MAGHAHKEYSRWRRLRRLLWKNKIFIAAALALITASILTSGVAFMTILALMGLVVVMKNVQLANQ